jgi:hypothetical protein
VITRARHRAAALVLSAGVALGLAGCSAEIVDDAASSPATGAAETAAPGAEGTPSAPRPADPAGATDRPTDDDSRDDVADDAADDPETGPAAGATGVLDRAEIEAAATTHLPCGGGELELATAGEVVVVTDDCGVLRVTAASVVVAAQDVDDLVVEAAATQVLVHEAGTLTLVGADNLVAYEAGSPAVSQEGARNQIGPTRS